MPGKNEVENKNATNDFLKTGGGKTKSNAIEIPSISLPKGGGAIKGIDEKFMVNAVNGTASFSTPLPFATVRGAGPAVTLSYNSGNGNGIFGLGWNLSLGTIKRKTEKKLPQYRDHDDSDTYVFSEAEDLVPEFKKGANGRFVLVNGEYVIYEKDSPDQNALFKIRFYKPRIEGLFARIERWTEKLTGIIKWRVITRDNTTTLFGWSHQSVIADPVNPIRIFEWLPEFVFDDKGNCTRYLYRKEDISGFDPARLHNNNRMAQGKITYTNTYLEKILYGNQTPYKQFGNAFPPESDFLFENIFDYGTLLNNELPDKINNWDYRADAFSDYKSGFEIRTTRLCKRILLFHHFRGANEYDGLVKSLNFEYDFTLEKDFTFLKSLTAHGYIKKAGSYSSKKLPSTEFTYQPHAWNKEVNVITAENVVHAPIGLDEQQYQFTDLYNEGLSGILTEQAGGWYYKQNLGNGNFEQAKLVTPKPSFSGLGAPLQLVDLDGNGGKQLVNYSTEPKGFFELDQDEEWQPLTNFQSLPTIDFKDANIRLLDLNGDGKPDILISDDNVFRWYESNGKQGFTDLQRTVKASDEEDGACIIFADDTQSIFLADMSGDGMSDIVRIRNGEVCYWPNLGYGNFGTKVNMDNAPVFDHPESFRASFIQLADIDGSGTTDIIYLGKNKFSCWNNLSGNSFNTTPFEIDSFPEIHNNSKITVTDLLGNGVACIVWSSDLSKDVNAPLRYIDLMNSRKPHVMIGYKNNLGKEVSMEYTASTHFYIQDKQAGKPWVTKLHFPVHCISKTETRDKISGYRFVSEYKYHHGYYDHQEKEFRGFGMVEQTDAEHFENWEKGNASNIVEKELHQEPVISKTWTHTGAFLSREKILEQFAHEYWYEDMKRQGFLVDHHEVKLPDARIIGAPGLMQALVDNLSLQECQQALRACKGMVLRSEVFAHDAARNGNKQADRIKELTPFSVSTHNCMIELLQPKGRNEYAIFIVKESESIAYSYERNPEDPRIAHNLNLKLDDFGNVLEAVSVVYPRKKINSSLPQVTQQAQKEMLITFTENSFTNDIDVRLEPNKQDTYRLRLPAEVKTWQLKGVIKANHAPALYSLPDFENILNSSEEVLHYEIHKEPDETILPPHYRPLKRLIEHIRTIYRNNNLIDPLAAGVIESLGIPHETYQLAYTKELLHEIYAAKKTDVELIDLMKEGKFVATENETKWWIPSGTVNFIDVADTLADTLAKVKDRFYQPTSYTDPYGSITKLKFGKYLLFIEQTIDALLNTVTVDKFNFRTLSPNRMRDANDNLSEVLTDEIGLVKTMAVMGKDLNNDGIGDEADNLSGLEEITRNEQTAIDEFFLISNASGICQSGNLKSKSQSLLKNATARFVYDFDAFSRSGKPATVAAILREQHFSTHPQSPVQISFEYTNGMGKVIMKKAQAEPGNAKEVTVDANGNITINETDTSLSNPKLLRWIGNGRTILNNKGNVVKQYEPFFSVSPKYEDEKELVETGVTPLLYYDAMGRLIKTEMPDGTFSKVEFDTWQQTSFDANDTVKDSLWYKKRNDSQRTDYINDPKEQDAAIKAGAHYQTPSEMHVDTLGRPILQIENNGRDAGNNTILFKTKIELDIESNLRKVTDARNLPENANNGNVVMEYLYDMLGNLVYQKSMDAGQRWLMINIAGNPLRTWDDRNHEFQYEYDILHRPVSSIVKGGDIPGMLLDHQFERVFYGENETDAKLKNTKGKAVRHFDTGGVLETLEYDFKGQPKHSTRKLFKKYKETANWTDSNLSTDLENKVFTFITETDALGRVTKQIAPDESIILPSYNDSGLLNSETVEHFHPALTTVYIKDIDYNEKGQRNKIIYGNDVITKFYYDKETFRLKRLETKRQNNDPLQDLYYTYDPVGNITQVEDKNIPVTFFDNQKVSSVADYTYDSIYRLVKASGRESHAALTFNAQDNWNDRAFMQEINPGDPMAVQNYTQHYQYDEVGNILEMRQSEGNTWKRSYQYEKNNNRLKTTTVGTQVYTYPHHPEHGFIVKMPHLEEISWNFKEELLKSVVQKVNPGNGIAETTWYQYDGKGQRIRKITENSALPGAIPTVKEERIYISGFELFKAQSGANSGLERTSLSLMDKEHRFVMVETRNDVLDGTDKRLVRYQLHNHLGSAALELNGTAQIISYEEFYPYGTTSYQAKNKTINCSAKRYRYTGMERDEETGLEYHSARYFVPWLGRWLSADPIGLGDGVNLFSYAKLNPNSLKDVSGFAADPANAPEVKRPGGLGAVGENLADTQRNASNLLREQQGLPIVEYDSQVRVESESGLTILDQGADVDGKIRDIERKSRHTSSKRNKGPGSRGKDDRASFAQVERRLKIGDEAGGVISKSTIVKTYFGNPSKRFLSKLKKEFKQNLQDWQNEVSGSALKLRKRISGVVNTAGDEIRSVKNITKRLTSGGRPNRAMKATLGGLVAGVLLAPITASAASSIVPEKAQEATYEITSTVIDAGVEWVQQVGPREAMAVTGMLVTAGKIGIKAAGTALVTSTSAAFSATTLTGIGTAGAGAVGVAAVAVVAAGAVGYGIGTLLNDHLIGGLIDKAEIGSGALGDWYYRTFLK